MRNTTWCISTPFPYFDICIIQISASTETVTNANKYRESVAIFVPGFNKFDHTFSNNNDHLTLVFIICQNLSNYRDYIIGKNSFRLLI